MLGFDGSEGRPVDLATAKQWAANYRATLKNPDDTLAHFFGCDIIRKVLNENDCKGIRIYYGLDGKGKNKLMLVGANTKGDNLLPAPGQTLLDAGGNTIVDYSYPCPDYCPTNSL